MTRAALLTFGVLVLVVLWLGPLPRLATYSFSAHMTMHMGVVAVAAPLLAIGVAGGRFDPVARAPGWFPPIPWSFVELAVVWAWHAPALHAFARQEPVGLVAEQGSFLLAGVVVWVSAFGGSRGGARAGAGVAALLLTSMHMTLLGALLALAPRPLHEHAAAHAARSALDDQQLGGAIMLLVGGVSYLAGGLWLTAALIRGAKTRQGASA